MDLQLSSRVQAIKPSPTLAVTNKAAELRAAGQDIIGLGAGEPDFDTPDHIKQAAIDAINNGQTKYTAVDGTPALKKAIIAKFKRDNGLEYEANQILVSSGGKQSFFNLALATLNEGDEAIIPAPYWVSYPEMVRLCGAEPVIVETTEENGWKMTADQFEEAMTPRTKMVIINSPGNPTGAVYSEEELRAIGEVASYEDIIILSDEIYEKLVYDGHKHVSIASISEELKSLTVICHGFAKAYSMTGWRLGWVIGPEALINHLSNLALCMLYGSPEFIQDAACAALADPPEQLATMRETYRARRDTVCRALTGSSAVEVLRPAAGMFMMIDIRRTGLTAQGFADRLLDEHGVSLLAGEAFGPSAAGFVRLSLTVDAERLDEACRRIERCARDCLATALD